MTERRATRNMCPKRTVLTAGLPPIHGVYSQHGGQAREYHSIPSIAERCLVMSSTFHLRMHEPNLGQHGISFARYSTVSQFPHIPLFLMISISCKFSNFFSMIFVRLFRKIGSKSSFPYQQLPKHPSVISSPYDSHHRSVVSMAIVRQIADVPYVRRISVCPGDRPPALANPAVLGVIYFAIYISPDSEYEARMIVGRRTAAAT